MAEEHLQRKLTTIFAADVEGFARHMREDEEATLKSLIKYREIIDGLIARHEGRIFSIGGDSVMAEFGSPVEAVRCAISCQKEVASRNAGLADHRKLMFRIGVNVGDIMVKGDNLFGDGVNVAARLEGLAEAGGVCISGSVYEQVRHKLQGAFEDMGPQNVKNIAEPISVFRAIIDERADSLLSAERLSVRRRGLRPLLMASGLAVFVFIGGLFWWQPWSSSSGLASVENMVLPLPDKPSLAVLPFINLSDDPNQEIFVDGLTEDLITDLSKIAGLFVIASNSTSVYKDKPAEVRTVSETLGVRYVLEGSVRRDRDQLRVNAQLIDGRDFKHRCQTLDEPSRVVHETLVNTRVVG